MRILVAMSGGVDSSLAAALLVSEGHEVIGATMKTFCYKETEGPTRSCCGLDGILDAKKVADHLEIPHYVFDVEEEFTRDVIDDFVAEYAQGRTPNPCVRCNSNTKFRDLLRRGRALGCEGIATGHYVQIRRQLPEDPLPTLHRGEDRAKDQAYFLWGLPQELLPLLHFPLGGLEKAEVRARARELALSTAEKAESQEICFVPSGDYRGFLSRALPTAHPSLQPGPIVDRRGQVLGEHPGYAGFTVGQRKGLGGGSSTPLFVLEVRPEDRAVVVGTREELVSVGVRVGGINWLVDSPPEPGEMVDLQIRHRAPARGARLLAVDEREGLMTFQFTEPEGAVTPGQSAAIFRGDQLLGGGRIHSALSAVPLP